MGFNAFQQALTSMEDLSQEDNIVMNGFKSFTFFLSILGKNIGAKFEQIKTFYKLNKSICDKFEEDLKKDYKKAIQIYSKIKNSDVLQYLQQKDKYGSYVMDECSEHPILKSYESFVKDYVKRLSKNLSMVKQMEKDTKKKYDNKWMNHHEFLVIYGTIDDNMTRVPVGLDKASKNYKEDLKKWKDDFEKTVTTDIYKKFEGSDYYVWIGIERNQLFAYLDMKASINENQFISLINKLKNTKVK